MESWFISSAWKKYIVKAKSEDKGVLLEEVTQLSISGVSSNSEKFSKSFEASLPKQTYICPLATICNLTSVSNKSKTGERNAAINQIFFYNQKVIISDS